jgi:hypothetical protein
VPVEAHPNKRNIVGIRAHEQILPGILSKRNRQLGAILPRLDASGAILLRILCGNNDLGAKRWLDFSVIRQLPGSCRTRVKLMGCKPIGDCP